MSILLDYAWPLRTRFNVANSEWRHATKSSERVHGVGPGREKSREGRQDGGEGELRLVGQSVEDQGTDCCTRYITHTLTDEDGWKCAGLYPVHHWQVD